MLAAIVNSLSRHQIDASEDDTVSTATRDRGTGTAVPLSDSTLPLSTDCRSNVGRPNAAASRFDTRTRLLLDGPILATLLRLATPNVLVMFVQASVGLIETYFVAKLGTDALAGVALDDFHAVSPERPVPPARCCPRLSCFDVDADDVGRCDGWRDLFRRRARPRSRPPN